jgi:mono/diheme cytochrome c family protein
VAAATSVSGNGFTLTSLSVELPSSDREFPPGPGVEAAQANCAACHSAGMILNQPALSRATWETEVHKMIAVYKAPVSEEDAKTIVAYLNSIKGAQ